jgi:hypothetical protein
MGLVALSMHNYTAYCAVFNEVHHVLGRDVKTTDLAHTKFPVLDFETLNDLFSLFYFDLLGFAWL